jgi:competence protein ComEC
MSPISKIRLIAPTGIGLRGLFAAFSNHIIGSFIAERARWVLWAPVLLGCGIGLYFGISAEPPIWLGTALLVVIATVMVICRPASIFLLAGIAALLVTTGFSLAQWRSASVAAPVIAKKTGVLGVEGRVYKIEIRIKDYRITLDRLSINRIAPEQTPEKIRVTYRGKSTAPSPGDRIRIRAILHPPPAAASPGAFDFARRAWFQSLGAVGFVIGTPEVISRAEDSEFAIGLANLRQSLTMRIQVALPGTMGAIAAALMTGDRGAIPKDALAAMRDAGLAHLLAISGLHIGLVGGLIFFMLRLIFACFERPALKYPVKKWAAFGALICSFAYLLISGGTLPTQRAFLMLSLAMLAIFIDRVAISMNLVAWAAMVILVFAPESLLNVSFQMSFAAVVALVAFYEAGTSPAFLRGARRTFARKALLYMAGVLMTTVIAGLATAPFAIFHFNRIALFGVLANLIAVPLAALWVMPFAIVTFALMPFGLEAVGLQAMGWGIDGILSVARYVQALPGAVGALPAVSTGFLILVTLGGVWLCFWRGRWRLWGIIPIIAGCFSFIGPLSPDLFVSETGRRVAVRTGTDELVFLKHARGFAAESWLRRSGLDPKEIKWPRGQAVIDPALRCDSLGCIYRRNGRVVAIVKNIAALAEDCTRADVVIAEVPVSRKLCPGPSLIIDRFDLWRNGPHVLWVEKGKLRVRSVGDDGGGRPWSHYPRKRSSKSR